MENTKSTATLSDEEWVRGILNNEETLIRHFFFEKCAPMLNEVIVRIFDGQIEIEKETLIHEFYLYLRDKDWEKLRQFNCRSKLTTWVLVVAVRFFQKKRRGVIENGAADALIG